MNSELQHFVREALTRGIPRAEIRTQLAAAGWRAEETDAALAIWAEASFPVPVPRRRPSLSAREAFLYLVMFATLYVTAFNSGQVLFGAIERKFHDPLRPETASVNADWMRGATAALIIAFPVYLLLSRLIGTTLAREPDKRGSAVRKWLTYLTLFLASLVLIGDLIALVTRALSGELAPRFLLKVLVVFAIAGTVFGHYLADLRREERENAGGPPPNRVPARIAALAVLAVIGVGLAGSGSPRRERLRQLDLQRVERLRRIQQAVTTYRIDRDAFPDSLGVLLTIPDTFGRDLLLDPVSGEPFEYRVADSLAFELCARFDAPDERGSERGPDLSEFWKHPAGRTCFTFQVNPGKRRGEAPSTIRIGESR